MTARNPYSIDPRLAKYALGWEHYAAMIGNEVAEISLAYAAYLAEHDPWDGEPQHFDDWLAAQHDDAADWDESTSQRCLAQDALRAEFTDPDDALRSAYATYRAVVAEPLTYESWLVTLARVAERFGAPCISIDSRQVCGSRRPHLRYIK